MLLSPQRDVPAVRRFLHTNGFAINDEVLLEDAGRFYHILDCSVGASAPYDEVGYLFGEKLITSGSAAFARYLQAEIAKTAAALSSVAASSPRYAELNQYLQLCKKLTSEV